ncbi:dynamin family protein [Neobacillus cucumis]|uniref:dynamin family protein n=1 Tax=Neobacillus cucumis TaxID=1740721 RepID=UPI00203B07ED|nr:dynamin family protein [Neobacillus cucumis]MCM3729123.1 dynamin family protein [Neobacillus cucumis]
MDWRAEFQSGIQNWLTLCNNDKEFQPIKEELLDLQEDANDELIVMVSGEFKAGKSTFINALLGKEILTSDVTPATAVVTKLTYGKKNRVLAHYLDHSVIEYDVKSLEQLTVEREGKFQQIREQISYIELHLPIQLLKTFTIIDTPGLNSSHKHHTEATDRFLRRADLAIWLFNYRNVGTSTEVTWLKKLKEYGIKPIAIVNGIDKHDEEEEELEELLDESFRKLQPFITRLIGVSSKEALDGKLQNNPELLEWSNWKEVDEIFQGWSQKTEQKIVRIFERLKEPLLKFDEILIERKVALGANRVQHLIEAFMNHEYPSLLEGFQRVKQLTGECQQSENSWNHFLKPKNDSLDGMIQLIHGSYNRLSGEKQKGAGKEFIRILNDRLLPDIDVFESDVAHFMNEFTKLTEDEEQLKEDWQFIESAHVLTRKLRRIKEHGEKLTVWKQHRAELVKKKQQLDASHDRLKDQLKKIERLMQASVEADIEELVRKPHRAAAESWNDKLANAKKRFAALSLDEIKEFDFFSGMVKSCIEGFIMPFQKVGTALENKLAYADTDLIMNNISALFDEIPLKQLEYDFSIFQSWEPSAIIPNNVKVQLTIPTEIEGIGLPSLPSDLAHDVKKAKDDVHEQRVQFAGWSITAVVVVFIVFLIINSKVNDDSPAYATDDSSYSDSLSDEDTYTEETDSVESLESSFSQSEIKDFISNLHQKRIDSDSTEFFNSETFNLSGEQEFQDYYYELDGAALKDLEIKNIDYDSTITVITDETYEKSGSEVVYEAEYELAPNSANTDLKVEGFTFSKLNETTIEATISEDTIRSFLIEYRTKYMDALNRDDSSSILSYLESGQPAYKLITDYFASIEGKGNIYTPEKFTITRVEHNGLNMYEVSTEESFILEESTGKKTENTRQRTYLIHVVKPDSLFISDFKVLGASTKEIIEPMDDYTTNNGNEYNSSGNGNGNDSGNGNGKAKAKGIDSGTGIDYGSGKGNSTDTGTGY